MEQAPVNSEETAISRPPEEDEKYTFVDEEALMKRSRFWFWICIIVALVLDLASKAWIFQWLEAPEAPEPGGPYGNPIWFIHGLVRITAVVNDGAAFGLGSGMTMVFVGAVAVVIPMIIMMVYHAKSPREPLWALGMIIGGALGNVYDRLLFSGVRDFIEITNPWTERAVFAIFNVADSFITIGAVIYFCWLIFFESKNSQAKSN